MTVVADQVVGCLLVHRFRRAATLRVMGVPATWESHVGSRECDIVILASPDPSGDAESNAFHPDTVRTAGYYSLCTPTASSVANPRSRVFYMTQFCRTLCMGKRHLTSLVAAATAAATLFASTWLWQSNDDGLRAKRPTG